MPHADADDLMAFTFANPLWTWRGPSPFHFIWVPEELCHPIRDVAAAVTYGWGMIPVRARIGGTTWETAMFPKDGRYVLPVKDAVRRGERLELDQVVAVELAVRARF